MAAQMRTTSARVDPLGSRQSISATSREWLSPGLALVASGQWHRAVPLVYEQSTLAVVTQRRVVNRFPVPIGMPLASFVLLVFGS